jgi:hypothetical protein
MIRKPRLLRLFAIRAYGLPKHEFAVDLGNRERAVGNLIEFLPVSAVCSLDLACAFRGSGAAAQTSPH